MHQIDPEIVEILKAFKFLSFLMQYLYNFCDFLG